MHTEETTMFDLFQLPDDRDDNDIYQFNLDPSDELEEMYDRPMPDELVVVVALFFKDNAGETKARAFLKELLAEGQTTSIPKYELLPNVKTCFALLALPDYLEAMMSSAQTAWWHQGIYVECGLWCSGQADDVSLTRGIAVAMTLSDAIEEPFADHQTIRASVCRFEPDGEDDPIPGMNARNFRLVVNDIFREGVGVWCRDLVMPRNEILIKVRARLAGVDPAREWERFQESQVPYFLDLSPSDAEGN
jgi:hypothetical protein